MIRQISSLESRKRTPAAATTFSSIIVDSEIVGPEMEGQLRDLRPHGDPGSLDVVEVVQHQAGHGQQPEIRNSRFSRPLDARVLRLKGPGNERRETAGPVLKVPAGQRGVRAGVRVPPRARTSWWPSCEAPARELLPSRSAIRLRSTCWGETRMRTESTRISAPSSRNGIEARRPQPCNDPGDRDPSPSFRSGRSREGKSEWM